jgi:hypothetical protein
MLDHAVGTCGQYLRRQIKARMTRAVVDEFTYPSIGLKYRRQKGHRLQLTPKDNQDILQYLHELLLLMMHADSKRHVTDSNVPVIGLIRKLPVLEEATTTVVTREAKLQQEIAVGMAASQGDDPWLVQLQEEYLHKLCFLSDIPARHKLYRICKISYLPSNKTSFACWEATMEPVHEGHLGDIYVADEDVVIGTQGIRLTRAKALLGYVLAQYIDGDNSEPTTSELVHILMLDALAKYRLYCSKCKM